MTEHETNSAEPDSDAVASESFIDPEIIDPPRGELLPEAAPGLVPAEIEALRAERDDFKDRWMRSEAESVNLRARAKRDVDDARQYAMQKFARDVAEAADNLRRGLDSLPKMTDDEPDLLRKLREGFEGVERSFIALLDRNGVTRTDPTHMPFDPNLHQAMSEQPSAEHPPGTVLQAWTACWTLNGRLLRPAMVVVSKAGESSAPFAPVDLTV